MTRRFTRLAWTAATGTYLLIVLGAVVRITGSGLGCGEHWPLCNGRLLPPLDLPTLIEYAHRLVAALVAVLVALLAVTAWWLRRVPESAALVGSSGPVAAVTGPTTRPSRAPYVALGLLILQVALGAVTVRLRLPPWTVILHLGTAMLLLATLLVAAAGERVARRTPAGLVALLLGFVTVLFGALTANLGAASACLGFPLCNGQLAPAGNALQHIHWTHRLLAYTLAVYTVWWAVRTRPRGAWAVVAVVLLQLGVGAAMVLFALPRSLQAAHVAAGAGVWAVLVWVVLGWPPVVSAPRSNDRSHN